MLILLYKNGWSSGIDHNLVRIGLNHLTKLSQEQGGSVTGIGILILLYSTVTNKRIANSTLPSLLDPTNWRRKEFGMASIYGIFILKIISKYLPVG